MKVINYEQFYGNVAPKHKSPYESPSISIFFYERKKLFIKEFKKYKKTNKNVNVLDIGTGNGSAIYELLKFSTSGDSFLGIDINKILINQNKDYVKENKLNNTDFKEIDLSKKNWPNQLSRKFDFIILSEVIEHLYPEDQKKLLDNISKILSKKGILIITCPNKNNLIKKMIRFFKKLPFSNNFLDIELKGNPEHVAELTYRELRKKSEKNFKIIKQGGLTCSFGNELWDKKSFFTLTYIFLNFLSKSLIPFWCFDQYVFLKPIK